MNERKPKGKTLSLIKSIERRRHKKNSSKMVNGLEFELRAKCKIIFNQDQTVKTLFQNVIHTARKKA